MYPIDACAACLAAPVDTVQDAAGGDTPCEAIHRVGQMMSKRGPQTSLRRPRNMETMVIAG
jgi:hypothetical protein